jgi:uncharacterized protein YraI
VVNVEALNLRGGPGEVYRVIGVLKKSDGLTIVGCSPDREWIQVIAPDGKQGWCAAWLTQLNVDLDQVKVAQNIPPAPTPAQPTATPTVAQPTLTTEPEYTPTPTPTPPQDIYVLYFYFGAEGCPYSQRMAPKVEQFYQKYRPVALLPGNDRPPGLAMLALPPIQMGQTKVDVIGVPAAWWGGRASNFVRATGITFRVGSDPGLPIDTSRIPVTVLYNKQTGVHRVITIGDVPYSTLENKVSQAVAGGSPSIGQGGA